jgi:two-component system sensor histidine kinase YesM
MITGSAGFLRRLIRSYILLLIVAVFVVGVSITVGFLSVLQSKQLSVEQQSVKILANRLESIYSRLSLVTLQGAFYAPGGIARSVDTYHATPFSAEGRTALRHLSFFLESMCAAESAYLDCMMVFANAVPPLHTSRRVGRLVANSFVPVRDPVIGPLLHAERYIEVRSDTPTRYLTTTSVPVLSFAVKLFDPDTIPERDQLATLIVNVAISDLVDLYRHGSSNPVADLYVTGPDGGILFASPESSGVASETEIAGRPDALVTRVEVDGIGLVAMSVLHRSALYTMLLPAAGWALLLVAGVVLAAVGVSAYFSKTYRRRLGAIMSHIPLIQRGDFAVRIPVERDDELGRLASTINRMSTEINRHIESVYQAEIERRKAELYALQVQIDPHFLYNTLEAINMRAFETGSQDVSKMLTQLGKLFRRSIRTDMPIVKLQTEIEYERAYLELQRSRFDDLLEIRLDIEPSVLNYGIPKLLMQPLVENAVIHGLSPCLSKNRPGRLTIRGYRRSGNIALEVIDDGVGFSVSAVSCALHGTDHRSESVGLSNVHRRAQLIYGEEFGLSIIESEGRGIGLRLTIAPLTTEELMQRVQSSRS